MKRLFWDILFLSIAVLSIVSCTSLGVASVPPLVVAHRGGAVLAPENTLLCIQRGMEAGADIIEIDVRMTADGHVVLMHDKSVARTTDGDGLVCELSFDSIRSLSVLDSLENVTDLYVPTLDEALSLVDGRCGLLIEVKDNDTLGIERAVTDAVLRHSAAGWVAVQSFSDDVLERFRDLDVSFPLEKLFNFKYPWIPYINDGGMRRFDFVKYDYISSFNVSRRYARPGLIKRLREAGKGVKVWTVKGGRDSFLKPVDAVITDYPHMW